MTSSYDPRDFDPKIHTKLFEPKKCKRCGRVFLNRWVFLRHRPEGKRAITEPLDPAVACYSDRHLTERLGMWQTHSIWQDSGKLSPLDEVPGRERQGHGKGRRFPKGNRYSARHQREQASRK
jgi:hypothetical protein